MRHRLILDGTEVEIEPPDLDGDGKVGGVEKLRKDSPMQRPQEVTELGQVVSEFNKDKLDASKLPSIDFLARIEPDEMSPMVAWDTLIGLEAVPVITGILNRVKMRKSVSLKGLGRAEFVELVTGKREDDKSKVGGFMGFGKKPEV